MTLGHGMLGGITGKTPPRKKASGKTLPSAGGGRGHSANNGWLHTEIDRMREDKRPLWGDMKGADWHPHAMGEECDRKSILGMYGYRGDPISVKLSRIFDMGKAVEKIWQADFQRMGLLVMANRRRRTDGPPAINGELDAIIRHPYEAGRTILVEIKSINCSGFKTLPPLTLDPGMNYNNIMGSQGYIGTRIRGYMIQLQSYMMLFEQEEGMLLMDNKCNSEYNDYCIDYHPELVERNAARLTRLDEFRPRLIIPPCTCGGKHDGLCNYRTELDVPLADMKKIAGEVDIV